MKTRLHLFVARRSFFATYSSHSSKRSIGDGFIHPPYPPSRRPAGGAARWNPPIFRPRRISKPLRYEPLFSLAILLAFEAVLGPKFVPFERSKSRNFIFQANNKKITKIIVFLRFWPHSSSFFVLSGRDNPL